MPINPAGTKPGLEAGTEEAPKIHIRCKGDSCDSMLAIEVKIAGQNNRSRLYQCCSCKRTWVVPVGGAIEL